MLLHVNESPFAPSGITIYPGHTVSICGGDRGAGAAAAAAAAPAAAVWNNIACSPGSYRMCYALSNENKTATRNTDHPNTITLLQESQERATGRHVVCIRVDQVPSQHSSGFNGIGFARSTINWAQNILSKEDTVGVLFNGGTMLRGSRVADTRALVVGDVLTFRLDCEARSLEVSVNGERVLGPQQQVPFDPPYRFAACMRVGGQITFVDPPVEAEEEAEARAVEEEGLEATDTAEEAAAPLLVHPAHAQRSAGTDERHELVFPSPFCGDSLLINIHKSGRNPLRLKK